MFVFVVLGLLAAAFVAYPLVRRLVGGRVGDTGVTYNHSIKAQYRARFGELDAEVADPALRDEIRDELGEILLDEVVEGEESAGDSGQSRWAWAGAAGVPLIGILVYFTVSDPTALAVRGAESVMQLDPSQAQAELESWRMRLTERVSAAPEDEKSWYILGHTYLKMQQYDLAAEAFATTNSLVENDLNVQVYWLQARYLAARGVLDSVSMEIAQNILKAAPDTPVVLEILALNAIQKGDPREAIRMLHRAATAATDLRQQTTLANALMRIREQVQDPPPGVDVAVSAEDSVPHFASVFVLARPVGGGMPYAVVKRSAMLLPLSVRLDDLVSMSDGRLLSDAENFEVVARVSRQGTAMPSADDWTWISEPLTAEQLNSGAALSAHLAPPGTTASE